MKLKELKLKKEIIKELKVGIIIILMSSLSFTLFEFNLFIFLLIVFVFTFLRKHMEKINNYFFSIIIIFLLAINLVSLWI